MAYCVVILDYFELSDILKNVENKNPLKSIVGKNYGIHWQLVTNILILCLREETQNDLKQVSK